MASKHLLKHLTFYSSILLFLIWSSRLLYMGKFWLRKKLANLTNCELFANIYKYINNIFGICTDCSLFDKFFLANSFYLIVC